MISIVPPGEIPRFRRNMGRPLADQLREQGLFTATVAGGALRQGFAARVEQDNAATEVWWVGQGPHQSCRPLRGPLFKGHDDIPAVVAGMREGLYRSQAEAKAMRS